VPNTFCGTISQLGLLGVRINVGSHYRGSTALLTYLTKFYQIHIYYDMTPETRNSEVRIYAITLQFKTDLNG
jgi:hypothetical protein